MTRPSFSRLLESFALCLSATAMAFTLAIAVELTMILVEQWPALRRAPAQQTELAIDRPSTSKASLRLSTKLRRRHARVAKAATVLNAPPALVKQGDADEVNLAKAVR